MQLKQKITSELFEKDEDYDEDMSEAEKINGRSIVYMLIFYGVAILILFAMTFHFIDVHNIIVMGNISLDAVITANESLPYENLIYALILYCLGMFGIEGTRSIVLSMDLKSVGDKAKNMPKYKRVRLLQMLLTFIILSITGMIFQINSTEAVKANYHLDSLFAGIGVFLTLLAYSDFAPKLSHQIGELMKHHKEEQEECEDEEDKKEDE
ncbi:MAG: hypothetical protein ACRC5M_04965 [Anaeroplasmataceae bacterium]